jgi:peptidoglycan LD-endopeptidase LytH
MLNNLINYMMKKDKDQLVTEPVDPFTSPKLCPTDAAGTLLNGARFGCSRNNGKKWHGGIDLKAAEGTKFVAIYGGKVPRQNGIRDLLPTDPNYKNGVGNYIIVVSDNFAIKYCHLKKINVKAGDTITVGQELGETGASGNAYNAPFKHLHVELSTDKFATMNNYVDPEPYLKTTYSPANPNSTDPGDCPAFYAEELDFVKVGLDKE